MIIWRYHAYYCHAVSRYRTLSFSCWREARCYLIEEKEGSSNASANAMMLWALLEMGLILKFLEQAEVVTVTSLYAMTDKDEVNLISAVLAKQMGAKRNCCSYVT